MQDIVKELLKSSYKLSATDRKVVERLDSMSDDDIISYVGLKSNKSNTHMYYILQLIEQVRPSVHEHCMRIHLRNTINS